MIISKLLCNSQLSRNVAFRSAAIQPLQRRDNSKLFDSLCSICTLSGSFKMNNVAPEELSIIYEDQSIIIVDKASNILSVPGKGTKPFTKFRCDQWKDAIKAASEASFEKTDCDIQQHLKHLVDKTALPRKEAKLKSYLSKALKVVDLEKQDLIWKRICEADTILHKGAFEDIPNHLVSSADLVEKHCGHKIFIVHRLDMETSGVIIYAKTENSASELCRQFREREIEKVYYAKVAHRVQIKSQVVSAPMSSDNFRPLYQIVDPENGKVAVTYVELFDNRDNSSSTSNPDAYDTSYVQLMPVTGRSHQLRVHCAHIGHPILGDTLYAPHDIMSMSPRLCLHAQTLKFKHPDTNELTTISSKKCSFFPNDFIYT